MWRHPPFCGRHAGENVDPRKNSRKKRTNNLLWRATPIQLRTLAVVLITVVTRPVIIISFSPNGCVPREGPSVSIMQKRDRLRDGPIFSRQVIWLAQLNIRKKIDTMHHIFLCGRSAVTNLLFLCGAQTREIGFLWDKHLFHSSQGKFSSAACVPCVGRMKVPQTGTPPSGRFDEPVTWQEAGGQRRKPAAWQKPRSSLSSENKGKIIFSSSAERDPKSRRRERHPRRCIQIIIQLKMCFKSLFIC